MSLPFGRTIRLGCVGPDVLAVKRALSKAGYGRWGGFTRLFGPFAVRNLKHFQKAQKLPVDGVYGKATHKKLGRFFDAYGRSLYIDPGLTVARAMLAFDRAFHGGYVYGGEHDFTLADDNPGGGFDCSSSTSLQLWKFNLLGTNQAQVSGWFESWGQPGRGRYVTVHANGDHVWTEFTLPEGWFRFDTSPWGDGGLGPRVRTRRRGDSWFVHRHPAGL